MKKIINPHITLMAVGILQPTSASEVRGFLTTVFSEGGQLPPVGEYSKFLEAQESEGRVIKISVKNPDHFSLTVAGTNYLPPKLRLTRDKFRMYLLRDARQARFILSRGESDKELAGVSPVVDTSSDVKGRAANKVVRRRASGRPYWPRMQGQFVRKTGLSRNPRDTFPPFLSYFDKAQVIAAGQESFRFDYFGIGLCLGVSPQLIWRMTIDTDRYYRSFKLPKKGGGDRLIECPRVFLKVVQSFLTDFVFGEMLVHPRVHSFALGRSIVTNAVNHVGKAFVGNVDIKDFFGSISRDLVLRLFIRHGFQEVEAEALSRLCTKQNRLPQGAPTSPVISNAILYEFDDAVSKYCDARGLTFSRYADDITVSGYSRVSVNEALLFLQQCLRELFGLELNEKKTRVSSRGGQQRVTGVVVNESAAPPRRYRRKIRAEFHSASKKPRDYVGQLAVLGGYLGYLKIFPKLQSARETKKYEQIFKAVKSFQRSVVHTTKATSPSS